MVWAHCLAFLDFWKSCCHSQLQGTVQLKVRTQVTQNRSTWNEHSGFDSIILNFFKYMHKQSHCNMEGDHGKKWSLCLVWIPAISSLIWFFHLSWVFVCCLAANPRQLNASGFSGQKQGGQKPGTGGNHSPEQNSYMVRRSPRYQINLLL